MKRRLLAVAALCLACSGSPLRAQDAQPSAPIPEPPAASTQPPASAAVPSTPPDSNGSPAMPATGRYRFSRVGNAVLRLDSESGQVSLCSERSLGWGCQVLPEDRVALETEISRLQSEIDKLKTEIAAMKPRPAEPSASMPPPKNSEFKLPSSEDLERARAFVEEAWSKLVDMIAAIQKDMMRKG